MNKIVFTFFLLSVLQPVFAQVPGGNRPSQAQQPGTASDTSLKRDNLGFEHRDDAKDSIAISFKYLDSIRSNQLDTNLNDFYKYYTSSIYQQYLGNNGAAGYPLIFTPFIKPGWDAGFHAFDAYRFSLESTKFYKTTRPFTQFDYMLATGKEQLIKVLHTQNPRPNLNIGLEYRLITSPGLFVTQNANNSNYRLFSNFQGKRKRYAAYTTLFRNSVKNSENGGMVNDSLLYVKEFKPRFTIPVNLGGDAPMQPDPFKSSVATGNIYKEFTFFLRQSYDIGKKDSIEINDSTTEYLFYPKLRALSQRIPG